MVLFMCACAYKLGVQESVCVWIKSHYLDEKKKKKTDNE